MLAKRVIPCLDVRGGRVVKGVRFVGLRDAGDPVEQATRYDAGGADEIALLDITASHERRGTLLDVVARTADAMFVPLTVGGGVRSGGRRARAARRGRRQGEHQHGGRHRARTSSQRAAARGARRPSSWRSTRSEGRRRRVGGLHPRRAHGDRPRRRRVGGRVARLGAGEILLTSMDRDGTQSGYDLELTRAVSDAVPVPVIASGGVGSLEHLRAGLVEGRAERRARREHLPRRQAHRRRGQAVPRARGRAGAARRAERAA